MQVRQFLCNTDACLDFRNALVPICQITRTTAVLNEAIFFCCHKCVFCTPLKKNGMHQFILIKETEENKQILLSYFFLLHL